jgi:hypothetical protein
MSKSRIVGMVALVVFVMGIFLVGDAVAGEKYKFRAVWYRVKFDSVNVPSEEGRIILILEDKGILTVLEGNKLMDGMAGVNIGCADVNTKTGTGFGHGETFFTDRDGDKMYWAWEGKAVKGIWSGRDTLVRATGKFKGMKGEGTFLAVDVAPNQFYVDRQGEIELPR